MYEFACNYNPEATNDDGSCDLEACSGCTYADAVNYDSNAVYDNGSCIFDIANPCPGDFDQDGVIDVNDLMTFLSIYGTICE